MKYRIRHHTGHQYSTTVLFSQQAARLTPRTLPGRQRCLESTLTADPIESRRHDDIDYFGNHVTFLTVETPHDTLSILAESVVEVETPPPPPPDVTSSWEDVTEILRHPTEESEATASEFIHDSPMAQSNEEVEAYARISFPTGRAALEGLFDLTRRIHDDFAFDAAATTVRTSLSEVLTMRRGVCQDFAHLQIAALRSLGLAARYVSGYLLTKPPPGQPKLVGSDASHAWVSVWLPVAGWIDLDPTNDMIVGEEHIVCAIGRDFEDVSPIKGVVVGGSEHALRVAVDVTPENG